MCAGTQPQRSGGHPGRLDRGTPLTDVAVAVAGPGAAHRDCSMLTPTPSAESLYTVPADLGLVTGVTTPSFFHGSTLAVCLGTVLVGVLGHRRHQLDRAVDCCHIDASDISECSGSSR